MRGDSRAFILAAAAATAMSVIPSHAQAAKPPVPVVPASLKMPAASEPVAQVAVRAAAASRPNGDDISLPREIIGDAMGYRGVPYVSGGDDRQGLDCSGLVYRAFFDTTGMSLPRGVWALFTSGIPVSYERREPLESMVLHIGDLLFFDTQSTGAPRRPSHVGIYAGAGRFIHAASEGSRTGVIVSHLSNPYYSERLLGARRVIPWRAPTLDVYLTDSTEDITTENPFPSRERMTIRIFNHMSGGGPMDLSVFKDGTRVLASRIAPGTYKPSEISLTPDQGTWMVRVNRLFKGRELQSVTFTVEE